MKIKLKIEAFGFPVGTVTEVDDSQGKQMVQDGDAVEVKGGGRKKIKDKAMSAKG